MRVREARTSRRKAKEQKVSHESAQPTRRSPISPLAMRTPMMLQSKLQMSAHGDRSQTPDLLTQAPAPQQPEPVRSQQLDTTAPNYPIQDLQESTGNGYLQSGFGLGNGRLPTSTAMELAVSRTPSAEEVTENLTEAPDRESTDAFSPEPATQPIPSSEEEKTQASQQSSRPPIQSKPAEDIDSKSKTEATGQPTIANRGEARDKSRAPEVPTVEAGEPKSRVKTPAAAPAIVPQEGAEGEAGVPETKVVAPEAEVTAAAPAMVAQAEVESGGGSPTVPTAEGGELPGGSEEEGASELEERLANADPARATADEADPADIAMGEPVEAEAEMPAEPSPEADLSTETPLSEPSMSSSPLSQAIENPESATESETGGDTDVGALVGAVPEEREASTPEVATEAEEPSSAEGFSGDEPALGGGAAEDMGAADLSPPEQKAALESIGESAGGGEPAGGGGGGSVIPDKPRPEPPKVANAEPSSALAQVGGLPPDQLLQALGDVGKAVAKSAGGKRADLAANPPQMARPTGSPKNLHGRQTAEPATAGQPKAKVEKVPEGKAIPTPTPKPLPELPPSPVDRVQEPAVIGGKGGELSQQDGTRLSDSMGSLPTHDPGLQVNAGPAPQVGLEGNADPAQADEQRQTLQASVVETDAEGRRDVAQELGENTKIYPSVPPETLTAKVPSGGAASGKQPSPSPVAGGTVEPEALSIVAQQEKGGEIQAAVGKAQQEMAAKQQEYTSKVSEEKTKSNQEIAALETQSATDQAQARAQAQGAVQAKKGEWSTEQTKVIREADKQADDEVTKGRTEVQKKKEESDRQAAEHIQKGNQEAETERLNAEKKAAEEKQKGEKESQGFFGWLASNATAFFNKIKAGIKAAFDDARKKIKQAIESAKKFAMAAIDMARNAIVSVIKAVGKALIAIGEKLLADFPALRDKFRKAIQNTVDAAVKKVNEYADQLKKDVTAALDALAAGLDKLVGWLEQGMLAAVDAAAAVVDGAIKFAEKVAQVVGAFAALIKDVASGPLKWLMNLGAGVVDGIKNHLWKAFKEAVQEWFNSKLEQVLGLGTMVWNLIKSGGLALAEVGKMAWEGIKALIPPTLIRILVEKLVAMIVPAAGAIMVIIEGLQAAWGAIQRIIAAFQKFFAFLKAVKTGNAGPAFAVALAAAAIAVIDFVANWLIAKLAKGAAKIGGKIKALAKKILGRKKGKVKAKKVKAKAKASDKTRKPKQADKKPTKGKKPTRDSDKKAAKQKDNERKKQERIEKARRELPPKIKQLLSRKPSKLRFIAQLAVWRFVYKIRKLGLRGKGEKFEVTGQINPQIDLADGWTFESSEIFKILDKIAGEYITDAESSKSSPAIPASALAPGKSYQVSQTEGGQAIEYSVKEYGKAVENKPTGITPAGESRWRPNYGQLRSRLKGVDVGDVLTRILRKERVPNLDDKQREAIGMLYALWFGKEPSHSRGTYAHRRDLTYSLMVSELMTPKEGQKKFDISAGIGFHPASFKGAQEGARQVTAEMWGQQVPQPKPGSKKERNRTIRLAREIALIKAWFKRHEFENFVSDRKPSIDEVEVFVRQKLRKYLRQE